MISRALALAAGVVYLLAGGWAFLFPASFYSAAARSSMRVPSTRSRAVAS